MAIDKEGLYIKVRVPKDMIERMDQWKEISGSTYSNTVRMAVVEYLDEKLGKKPIN